MCSGAEEKYRFHENPNKLFVNKFPLVEMGTVRADNYAYFLYHWGLESHASACAFCPFHRNYFFCHIKEKDNCTYRQVLAVDENLKNKNPKPPMKADLFISRSRKRIVDLTAEDCDDRETFLYDGEQIWNGF